MNDKIRITVIVLLIGSALFVSFIMFVMSGLKQAGDSAKTARSDGAAYEAALKAHLENPNANVFIGEITNLPQPVYNLALAERAVPGPDDNVPQAGTAGQWPDLVSMTTLHFILYGYNQDILKFIAARIENYYENLVNDTGLYEAYAPNGQLKVYIFRDKVEYMSYTKMPDWTSGCAGSGAIYSYEAPQLKFIIPHELAHLMFSYFLGNEKDYSKIKCIYEGIAVYLEMKANPKYRKFILSNVYDKVSKNRNIPLDKLTNVELLNGTDKEAIDDWYSECGALIDFLITAGGKSKFYSFANALKMYADVDAALNYAYPGEFSSLLSMKAQFANYLKSSTVYSIN